MGGAHHLGKSVEIDLGIFALSRFLILPIALAGLVLVALIAGAARNRIGESHGLAVGLAENASTKPQSAGSLGNIEPEKAVRAVEPDKFVPPFGRNVTGLERIEARAVPVVKKDKVPEAGQTLPRPTVGNPGLLTFGDRQVFLDGLKPMARTRTCQSGGSNWPCGEMASTALRRFLRGRSVTCDIKDADWTGRVTARCDLGKQDIAGWLVEHGWAEAAVGSDYVESGQQAMALRLGLYGDDPRGE
jgi:hypothetical protein